MGRVQQTDLKAFEADLAAADEAVVQALAQQSSARRALNDRRAEDGLEPLVFDEEETSSEEDAGDSNKRKRKAPPEKGDEEKASKDSAPDDAGGFGGSRGGAK